MFAFLHEVDGWYTFQAVCSWLVSDCGWELPLRVAGNHSRLHAGDMAYTHQPGATFKNVTLTAKKLTMLVHNPDELFGRLRWEKGTG